MSSKIYLLPNLNSKRIRVQKWLDSKVNDRLLLTKYDVEKYHIGIPLQHSTQFDLYYKQGKNNNLTPDQDVAASDSFYTELINSHKLLKYELDDQLTFIDSSIQRYDSDSILIAPHCNRWHTNYLFRQLVDYCVHNELFFYTDSRNEQADSECLIDSSFKDAFYEFCYDNTTINKV